MTLIDEIAADYRKGCTLACLGLRYRVSDTTIMRWLRLAGVPRRAPRLPRDWKPDTNERIESMLDSGISGVAIAAELGVSVQHVSRVRRRKLGH